MIQSKTSKDFEQCDKSSVDSLQVRLVTQSYTNTDGHRVGFRGGAKGAEAPPLQVNEMRNIHFGQNTNSHLSETSEK